jgi:hypothetical protein
MSLAGVLEQFDSTQIGSGSLELSFDSETMSLRENRGVLKETFRIGFGKIRNGRV